MQNKRYSLTFISAMAKALAANAEGTATATNTSSASCGEKREKDIRAETVASELHRTCRLVIPRQLNWQG